MALVENCTRSSLADAVEPGVPDGQYSYIHQKHLVRQSQADWLSQCDTFCRLRSRKGRHMTLCQNGDVLGWQLQGHRNSVYHRI